MTVFMDDRLVGKLTRIRSGAYSPRDFIIADAKDAEIGGGIGALGARRLADGTERLATSVDYRQAMTEMMASGLIDIMLTSMSSAEALADSGAFKTSDVTQAIRLNDATDTWGSGARSTGSARRCRLGRHECIMRGGLPRSVSML